jgi:uncharacterized protein (TIRG00374 family)
MKLKNIIFLLIGLGVLAYILVRMEINIDEVIKSVKSPHYIVLAAAVLTAIPLINAFRMRYIIAPVEKKMLSMHDLFVIEYIYKFLSNVMPFKLNIPAKAVLLKKFGLQLSSGASVVSFEYALDSGVTIAFGFLGVIAYFRDDPRISLLSIKYFILIVLSGSIIFFSIPAYYFDKALSYTEAFKIKLLQKIAVFLVKMMNVVRVSWARILLDRRMFAVLFATILTWGASVLVNMLLFMSTNNYVAPTWILVVMSVGIFVGGVSTIPGGLGVREATMVMLYSALGVPAEVSVANVLIGRLISLIPILIGYVVSIHAGAEMLEEKAV